MTHSIVEQTYSIFQFQSNQVRVVIIDGEPWFVAKDVCDVLDIQNIRQNLSKLDEDQKGVYSIYTPGGNQDMQIVSEGGLYALIFKSRKEQAKNFRRWVTSEVIPTIRKTGSYSLKVPQTPSAMLFMVAEALKQLEEKQAVLEEEQLMLKVEQQVVKTLAEKTEAKVTVLEAEMVALKAAIAQPIPTCKQTARQRIVELAQLMANYLVKSKAYSSIQDAIREVWNRINLKVRNSSLRIDLASRRANNKRQYEADLKAWELSGKPKGNRPVKKTYALTAPQVIESLGIETDTLKCAVAVASELASLARSPTP